jgi:hypothetical protein
VYNVHKSRITTELALITTCAYDNYLTHNTQDASKNIIVLGACEQVVSRNELVKQVTTSLLTDWETIKM